jgi:hypothetical protein
MISIFDLAGATGAGAAAGASDIADSSHKLRSRRSALLRR